ESTGTGTSESLPAASPESTGTATESVAATAETPRPSFQLDRYDVESSRTVDQLRATLQAITLTPGQTVSPDTVKAVIDNSVKLQERTLNTSINGDQRLQIIDLSGEMRKEAN